MVQSLDTEGKTIQPHWLRGGCNYESEQNKTRATAVIILRIMNIKLCNHNSPIQGKPLYLSDIQGKAYVGQHVKQ